MFDEIAASQTAASVGRGVVGDRIDMITIVPATTSPGAVSIQDGSNAAVTLFAGGASSVSNLVPFQVWWNGEKSKNGAWKITTGANVSVILAGDF